MDGIAVLFIKFYFSKAIPKNQFNLCCIRIRSYFLFSVSRLMHSDLFFFINGVLQHIYIVETNQTHQ